MMYCGEVCNFCVRDCLLEDVIIKIFFFLQVKNYLVIRNKIVVREKFFYDKLGNLILILVLYFNFVDLFGKYFR